MNKELYKKYLNNKCSPEETDEILKWFQNDAGNILEQTQVKKFWDEYEISDIENIKNSESEVLLDKIHHRINLNEAIDKQGVIRYHGKRSRKILIYLTRAAAMLFIPLLFTLLYTYYSFNLKPDNLIELNVPIGSVMHEKLPDGTEVWLNQGSNIKYPLKFKGNIRKVFFEGEGYFKIAHNPKKPFVAEMHQIDVVATGTEFNISAYPDERVIETTLVTGKVTVNNKSDQVSPNQNIEMFPGQQVVFDLNNNQYTCKAVYIENYVSWKDSKLIFKHATLKEILKRLSRLHNIEFVFVNKELEDLTYNATFIDETMPQMLNLLEKAAPIQFKVSKREKLPDGTYTKARIFVSQKKR